MVLRAPAEATNLLQSAGLRVFAYSASMRPWLSCQAEQKTAAVMRLNPHKGPEGHHAGIVRSVVLSVSVGHNNTIPVRRCRSRDPICFPILFGLQDKIQIVSRNYLLPWNGAVMEAEAKR